MTTHDLFRCIGNLRDEMIEESAEIRRKPRWLPIAALAACAVLAVSIPLAVRSIGACKSASTATSAAETPAMEAPADLPEEEAAAEDPGTRGEASGGWEDDDPTAARILATELGGLRLGMTESKILAIAGTPDGKSNSGVVQRDDGIQEICWFYNTSGSTDIRHDTTLTLAGTDLRGGSDAVLSEIWLLPPSTWTLDTGIGIGSPQEAVDAAYPDAARTYETRIEDDQEIACSHYELRSGDLFLQISVEESVVSHIWIGGLNAYHETDETAQAAPDPYAFTPYETLSGETVTAYTRTENGWEKQTLSGQQAKMIVTVFNITDPEPYDAPGEPVIWLEFESGGVAALYDESGAGAIYRLEDPSAFEAALSSGEDPKSALTLIGLYRFAGVWDTIVSALGASPE